MTDTPTPTKTDADEQPTDQPFPDPDATGADTDVGRGSAESAGLDPNARAIRRYLAWGALGVCSLLAVVALIQFYGSMTAAIDLWIDPKYQPLMRAAFNLAVLLTSLIGVSLLVRELS